MKIDLDQMNQYQFWKYVERLKEFERKEVVFHTKLKTKLEKLHSTYEAAKVEQEKPRPKQEIIKLNKKKQ